MKDDGLDKELNPLWRCCERQMIRGAKDGSHYGCLACGQRFTNEGIQIPQSEEEPS